MRPVLKNPALPTLSLFRRDLPFPFSDRRSSFHPNARAAIWHGLAALGLSAGDRILIPAYHCGSELDVMVKAGLEPIFYGLGPDLATDPDRIRSLAAHRPRAIYIIHYFGYPQPTRDLVSIARSCGAALIEDVALGLWSSDAQGEPLGCQGDASVFSLVKSLPVPDGGVLWLREGKNPSPSGNPPVARTLASLKPLVLGRIGALKAARKLTQKQIDRSEAWDAGASFDPSSADWGASGLTRLMVPRIDHQGMAGDRRRNYDALHAKVPRAGPVRALLPPRPVGACPAYFPLWCDDAIAAANRLLAHGIEAVLFWRSAHPSFDATSFPFEAKLKRHVLRLPIHSDIGMPEIARIAAALASA